MKRLSLDMAFFRILVIAVPFSCGPQTFFQAAPVARCGSDRVVPLPAYYLPYDGGVADGGAAMNDGGTAINDGGVPDAGSPSGVKLTDSDCARICGDTMTCQISAEPGTEPAVVCITQCYGIGCGRRPADLPVLAGGSKDALAHYFEQAAYLEAASVHAFLRLQAELQAHDAPQPLIDAAARAAADEIRHTKVMSRLARRFGGAPRLPKEGPRHIRPLAEIALENAMEGCVRETYGAIVAWLQAARAGDPFVKRALGSIAQDETAHARLAFAVADWIDSQLADSERRIVENARLWAAAQLAEEVEAEPPAALIKSAGLPDRFTARRLVAEAQRSLWLG